MGIFMVGKNPTPRPRPFAYVHRQYYLMATCYNKANAWSCSTEALWFPVTCKRESVEHWDSAWIGMDEQKCAWNGRWWRGGDAVMGVRREAGQDGRGDDFLLIVATDSSCPSPSLPIHPIRQNLVPFHKKHAQDIRSNPRICHIVLFGPRMPLESIATHFRYNHARKYFKRFSI